MLRALASTALVAAFAVSFSAPIVADETKTIGSIDRKDAKFDEIIPKDAKIELLAAGQTVSAETLLHQAVTATCTCRRPADVADPTAAEADANASDSAAGTTTEAATKPPEDADRRGDVDSQDSVADAENETATEAADLASSESDSGPQYSAGGAENETATEAAELATCECGAGPQDSAGGAENDFGPVLVGCPAPGGAPCSCPEPGNDELCSGACTAAAGKQWSLPTRQGRRTHATVVLPWNAFSRLDALMRVSFCA
jgi:hypothetical protein